MIIFQTFAMFIGLFFLSLSSSPATADDQSLLQGTWQAESAISHAKELTKDKVASMQFIFNGDKLTIKGNFSNDSSEEDTYKVDSSQSPKQITIYPLSQTEPVLGIYELNGDELKICVRNAPPLDERPTDFNAAENVTVVIFEKQK